MDQLVVCFFDQCSVQEKKELLKRPAHDNPHLLQQTEQIIATVKEQGDNALRFYTEKFDGVRLDDFKVSAQEIESAINSIDEKILLALDIATKNITAFHQQQKPKSIRVSPSAGIMCEKQFRPIQRVGLYVPGGTAPLPSTVLMLGLPARIANNPLRVLVTPPQKNGHIHPVILAAAHLCGIEYIYAVGGAHAIAALAYGTDSIPKVDKIFGPGNAWVTQAKLLVALDPNGAAMDLPAGPSEVMVIADDSANPVFVAADLLSQAEHNGDSHVVLLTTDVLLAQQVIDQLRMQTVTLARQQIINASLAHARIIVVNHLDTANSLANYYAPEHLILAVRDPDDWVPQIFTAGSIFCGHFTPEAAGDYASGTNHVLPTYGFARNYSGLSVTDFMRGMSVQTLTEEGLMHLGPHIEVLAEVEGLTAHKQAVRLRIDTLE